MKIGIVGLGLIGGSLAKALSSRTDCEIVGVDIDPETVLHAHEDRAVSAAGSVDGCDIVFVCLHPEAAAEWLRCPPPLPPGAIVADTCGVKRWVRDAAEPALRERGLRYVGTHPMAGRETGGYESSSADLFTGASWILTCGPDTDLAALRTVEDIVREAGAASVPVVSAEEHDDIIAYTSQLAHAVSNTYVKNEAALQEHGFTAGSFQDLTRVARLDPNLWTELFLANADDLVRNMDEFMDNLKEMRDAIETGDRAALRQMLAEGNDRKLSILRMDRAIDEAEAQGERNLASGPKLI